VQWGKDQMQIAAGCGVVADSVCDKEWNEINLKLKAVKEMLAL
jgi:isochorismate synthase EntC